MEGSRRPLRRCPGSRSGRRESLATRSVSMLTRQPTSKRGQSRLGQRRRNKRNREAVAAGFGHGKAHTIDGNGTFRHQLCHDMVGRTNPETPADTLLVDPRDFASPVDVTLHEMTVEGGTDLQGRLDVDSRTRDEFPSVDRRRVSPTTPPRSLAHPLTKLSDRRRLRRPNRPLRSLRRSSAREPPICDRRDRRQHRLGGLFL